MSRSMPGLALLVVALAAACSAPDSPISLPRPAVIAWTDSKAPIPPTPAPPTPLKVRHCRAADLSARPGRAGVGAGNYYEPIVLTDVSSTPCSINSLPAVRLLDADGHAVPMPPVTTSPIRVAPVLLLPNVPVGPDGGPAAAGQASFALHTATMQCRPVAVAKLEVILPDGGGLLTLPLDWPPSFYPGCYQGAMDVEFLQSGGPPATPAPPDLQASIVAPPVTSGSRLRYQVVLTNTSDHTIRFTECPGYTESLKVAGVVERHQLNCLPVGPLLPKDKANFAMEMDLSHVTATPPSSLDYLGWSLDAPWSVGTSTIVRVT